MFISQCKQLMVMGDAVHLLLSVSISSGGENDSRAFLRWPPNEVEAVGSFNWWTHYIGIVQCCCTLLVVPVLNNIWVKVNYALKYFF